MDHFFLLKYMHFLVLQLDVHVVSYDRTPQRSTIESYFVKKTDNLHECLRKNWLQETQVPTGAN